MVYFYTHMQNSMGEHNAGGSTKAEEGGGGGIIVPRGLSLLCVLTYNMHVPAFCSSLHCLPWPWPHLPRMAVAFQAL